MSPAATLQRETSPRAENRQVASNSSRQERNVTGRDMAGRDINYYGPKPSPPSTLRELALSLQLEGHKRAQPGFIAQLQHFAEPPSDRPSRDLEQKLRDSARDDLLVDALAWKEQFSKKLSRLQFSEQAQELFTHILSKIHTFFVLHVRPRVLAGAERTEIDNLIYQLISELYGEVGIGDLDITMTDLQGMIYFLAGNCHIDWE